MDCGYQSFFFYTSYSKLWTTTCVGKLLLFETLRMTKILFLLKVLMLRKCFANSPGLYKKELRKIVTWFLPFVNLKSEYPLPVTFMGSKISEDYVVFMASGTRHFIKKNSYWFNSSYALFRGIFQEFAKLLCLKVRKLRIPFFWITCESRRPTVKDDTENLLK